MHQRRHIPEATLHARLETLQCAFLQTHAQLSSRVSLRGPRCFISLQTCVHVYFCLHESRIYLPILHNDSLIICVCAHTSSQMEVRSCIERHVFNMCSPCCSVHSYTHVGTRTCACMTLDICPQRTMVVRPCVCVNTQPCTGQHDHVDVRTQAVCDNLRVESTSITCLFTSTYPLICSL